MDASADDPQRFRIRRSPSISTSASTVTTAARVGKRKLSTAAFSSSPSMGAHPPSSPITSEHPTDSIHGVSQVASTSRSTIDNADNGRPAAGSDKASNIIHQNPSAQFSDWQDQRRCNSLLADFDYSPPTAEDRRDPRSSNACIVMPVSSSQSQVMSASAAHDLHQSDPVSQRDSLQPPPLTSCGGESAQLDAQPSPLASGSSSREQQNEQTSAPRAAQLQSSLSQTSLSVPPSPDLGISPSPSFSAFGYGAQSTPIPQRRPSSAALHPQTSHLGQSPAGRISETVASERCGISKQQQVVHRDQAQTLVGHKPSSAAESARPWLRTSSLQLSEPKQLERSAVPVCVPGILPPGANASRSAFQLQPVPAAKRRRIEDASISDGVSKFHNLQTVDDARRCSDAGLPFHLSQVHSSRNVAKVPKGVVPTDDALPDSSSNIAHKYNSLHPQAAPSTSFTANDASASIHRTQVGSGASSKEIPIVGHGITSRHGSKHFEDVPAYPSVAPPRPQHTIISRKMPRLVRAQSVPNLRAKATLDITAPSHHRLVLPSHWASYVSSHARQGREGASTSAKCANTRSSKGYPFNVAHHPSGANSSRSRSIFTPTLHPPITRHTLRELDLFEILKNPQLRHDVVFDPNVQFRPNFDGERGRRKREAGERYWTAVVREIETGCTCTAFSNGQLLPCTCKAKRSLHKIGAAGTREAPKPLQQSRIPSRIPLLVQELRTICLSILPSNYPADALAADTDVATVASATEGHKADEANVTEAVTSSVSQKTVTLSPSATSWTTTHHQLIAQTLDPHLISQELQHGVLDVPSLITFMGSILKLHCAPMRDEAIDKMVEVVCVGRNIGKGLRLCFEILELMKLDIANHQLRSARPFLVETAVDFEIRWFKEQIEQGKMSLEKTTAWIQQVLSSSNVGADTPRNEAMIKAFNQGMLQLIFDVPGSLPLLSPVATPLGSPSSSSLNNTFASLYPETFQFDAYRMMTFHNDVSDLTIVYMLVLLFRQLCSTPLDDGKALPASVGSIVHNQLKGIKGEIWCLVNDANLCLSSSSALPPTPTAATGAGSPTRRNAGVDGKLFLGSAGGFAKLDHPRWRRAMQNVLLQVAARAAAVQMAARAGSSDPSTVKAAAPSTATQKLLNSWMDTNLRSGSALHKICQSRLRDVVQGMLGDKVRNGLQPSPPAVVCASAPPSSVASLEADRPNQKRAVPSEIREDKDVVSAKRLRSDVSFTASPSSDVASAATAASPWDASMSRAGLDPFAAEIRLLSERIAKVATFHLRVFRNLYEGIESGRHKSGGGIQRS